MINYQLLNPDDKFDIGTNFVEYVKDRRKYYHTIESKYIVYVLSKAYLTSHINDLMSKSHHETFLKRTHFKKLTHKSWFINLRYLLLTSEICFTSQI